jgi:peptide/nickel transport system substrate-binding protein
MVMPIWRPVYTIVAKNVNGYQGHPTEYHQFNRRRQLEGRVRD